MDRAPRRDPLPSVPPPETPCRWATAQETPAKARTLINLAERIGWRARATFARGTYATSTTHKVVDSYALRLQRDARCAVGIWHDNHFHLAFWWSDLVHPRTGNLRELRDWLVDGL
jgi:hypothetical protein